MLKKKIFISMLFIVLLFILTFSLNKYLSDSKLTLKVVENKDIIISHGARDKKTISLTFDDGPHPKETDQILDILKKYNIKGTFFIAGKHSKWYSKPLKRAIREGHEIGNHTFNHVNVKTLSKDKVEMEIKDCEESIKNVTGVKTKLFRPPYGSYNRENLEDIAKRHNYKVILWSGFDARDWDHASSQKIVDGILKNIQNGDIILLHDYGTPNTVKALNVLIPKLKEKGYKFLTVTELINQ